MNNLPRQLEKLCFDGNRPKNLYNILMECNFYLAAAHPEATGKASVSNHLLNVADHMLLNTARIMRSQMKKTRLGKNLERKFR